MDETTIKIENPIVDEMFKIGAQYGYSKSRRHPSAKDLIFGVKNKVEIWDLEKTADYLLKAKAFVNLLAKERKQILFVGGKNEAKGAILEGAQKIDMPYVAGRWIGGALTNYSEIRKRVTRLETLVGEKERGDLAKYTKKERLLIDREIENLEKNFRGLVSLKGMPAAIFIIDPKREHIALREAHRAKVPVIALMNTDCDLKDANYPIPANDSSVSSIKFFVEEIVKAYEEGLRGSE